MNDAPTVQARIGTALVGTLGLITLISCTLLLGVIGTRTLLSLRPRHQNHLQSQGLALIVNLVCADLLQSLGFLVEWHWFRIESILAPSMSCSVQGFFIQIGDIAQACFVILIAIHTAKHVLQPDNAQLACFKLIISVVWLGCFASALVPMLLEKHWYSDAGIWCWISHEHQSGRLYLLYMFVFAAEGISLVVYSGVAIHLFQFARRSKSKKLIRIARTLLAYPLSYTLGTLPLASARVKSMLGKKPSELHLIVACVIFSSVGIFNCLLFVVTRRNLLQAPHATELSGESGPNTAATSQIKGTFEDVHSLVKQSRLNEAKQKWRESSVAFAQVVDRRRSSMSRISSAWNSPFPRPLSTFGPGGGTGEKCGFGEKSEKFATIDEVAPPLAHDVENVEFDDDFYETESARHV